MCSLDLRKGMNVSRVSARAIAINCWICKAVWSGVIALLHDFSYSVLWKMNSWTSGIQKHLKHPHAHTYRLFCLKEPKVLYWSWLINIGKFRKWFPGLEQWICLLILLERLFNRAWSSGHTAVTNGNVEEGYKHITKWIYFQRGCVNVGTEHALWSHDKWLAGCRQESWIWQ